LRLLTPVAASEGARKKCCGAEATVLSALQHSLCERAAGKVSRQRAATRMGSCR